MKTRRTYRPSAGEALEDRSVPSGFGGILGDVFGGGRSGTGSLPTQDAQKVSQAFQNFEQTYSRDVAQLIPSRSSTTPITRAQFDANVLTALQTLETTVNADIANLPSAATLTPTIDNEILTNAASSTTSLQATLQAIPTPTATGARAARAFAQLGQADIGQVASEVVQQVRSAPAPTGTISQQTVQTVLSGVASDYQTFSQDLNSDLQSIGSSGTSSTNQATYQADVAKEVQALNASIDQTLGANLPSSLATTLEATVQKDLLSPSSSTTADHSLQGRLDALTYPSGNGFFSTLRFRIGLISDIATSEGQVSRDITTGISQYNNSLGGSTTTT